MKKFWSCMSAIIAYMECFFGVLYLLGVKGLPNVGFLLLGAGLFHYASCVAREDMKK